MSRQLSGDIFVAGVINQKAVNQNTQQIRVLVALQVAKIIEAQFGFAEKMTAIQSKVSALMLFKLHEKGAERCTNSPPSILAGQILKR